VPKKITSPTLSRWGGFDYAVTWHPKGSVKLEDGSICYGTTDHDQQEIKIEEGLTPEREADVLIHETTHQLLGSAKKSFVGLTEHDDLEEAVCEFIGTALAGHIRDNPDFWRYLIRRCAPRKRSNRV
jgi:hypothetical protein